MYTKGKWHQDKNTIYKTKRKKPVESICTCEIMENDKGYEECMSNARLISASPLLLEALKAFMSAGSADLSKCYKMGQQAIKQAEGE